MSLVIYQTAPLPIQHELKATLPVLAAAQIRDRHKTAQMLLAARLQKYKGSRFELFSRLYVSFVDLDLKPVRSH